MSHVLNIAVEGCLHGELDAVYSAVREAEQRGAQKVDVLIICGDFQSVRNQADLSSLEVPEKYKQLGDFHKYASGELTAPCLTLFIGGNHEASNVLKSLYYGGWVAPNIYFLGFAGVVSICGVRIAGCSGIFNGRDYNMGHFEEAPYDGSTRRSIYHTRELEVYRLKRLAQPVDIMLSHDWPTGIWRHGDAGTLLRYKPFLREDMDSGRLGSRAYQELMTVMKPKLWFAAHLHCKFAALVVHQKDGGGAKGSEGRRDAMGNPAMCMDVVDAGNISPPRVTRFLSLDKVIPGRDFLQFMQIPISESLASDEHKVLHYDPEWLAVLTETHTLLQTGRHRVQMPSCTRAVSPEALEAVTAKFVRRNGSLVVPAVTAEQTRSAHELDTNVQTDQFLETLGLPHIWTRSQGEVGSQRVHVTPITSANTASVTGKRKMDERVADEGATEVDNKKIDLDDIYFDEGEDDSPTAPPATAVADCNEINLDDV